MTAGQALLGLPGADSVLSSREEEEEEEGVLQHWEKSHLGCCLHQSPACASPLLDELQGLNTQECEG